MEILICRRRPEKILGGFWEFPGGKLEDFEDEIECLQRELNEELRLTVKNLKFIHSNIHNYQTFQIKLISYLAEIVNCDYSMNDHDLFHWISHSNLFDYDLAPADIEVARLIKKHGIKKLIN